MCSVGSTPPDSIICSSCSLTFHPACVQLLPSDIDYIKDVSKKWQCSACLQVGRKHRSGSITSGSSRQQIFDSQRPSIDEQFNRLFSELSDIKSMQRNMGVDISRINEDISRIKDSQVQVISEMNAKCASLQGEIESCSAVLVSHTDLLNEHSTTVSNLSTRLVNIEADLRAMKSNTGCNASASFETDEVVSEIAERQRRSRNVMIFGVAEAQGSGAEERKAADNQFVTTLFSFLGSNVTVVKVLRVGTFTQDRKRPLKVVVNSEGDVLNIIRGARRLRENVDYRGVSVSFDRTPRQISQYKEVKRQLDNRKADGERNLKLRYVSGVPKIVHLN